MKPSNLITVHALHADGHWYRRWQTTVESVDEGCVITDSPLGSLVEDIGHPPRVLAHAMRSYYWFDKLYNLHERISADGSLVEIYIDIASPPNLVEGGMVFTDHELDVMKRVGEPAVILDEDEFETAITTFGYTPEFVTRCRVAAEEARLLAEQWQSRGPVRALKSL